MTDLATTSDLAARLGRSLTSAETTRAAAYLPEASRLIRDYTKYSFATVTGATDKLRPVGMELRLPRRPVNAVNSVTAIGWGGTANVTLPQGFWGWDGIDIVTIAPYSDGTWISLPEYEMWGYPDTYIVNYDHGNATIPESIVGICCNMVLAPLTSPSLTAGLNTQKVGEYSFGMQQGGVGTPGASVRLTELDKQALKDAGYGPRQAATIQVRL